MKKRDELLGLKALIHDAVDATVDLVRDGHESVSRSINTVGDVAGVGEPTRKVEAVRMKATRGVLSTVTFVNRSIEIVSNAAIDRAWPASEDASTEALPLRDDIALGRPWWNDAVVGGLNGAIGDHLVRSGNPLGVDMVLRIGDRYYVPDRCDANEFGELENISVFVHGLGTTEWSWVFGAEQSWGDPSSCFGTRLEDDLNLTPVWVRYNTGRTISENGLDLARLLTQLEKRAPNLRSIVLLGHSMGGLVVRQACCDATEQEARWPELVRHVFYLGSPHQGAPLARFARGVSGVLEAVDLPATQIISRIIEGRSEGVKNLADGLESALALPDAHHTFISGSVTTDPDHPVGKILGDLLVQRKSAADDGLERHNTEVSRQHQGRVKHHEVQNHPAVYELILDALDPTTPSA